MKKVILIFAVFIMLICALPVMAEETTGTCGEGVTWELSEDGILTISGKGAMWDFTDESQREYAQQFGKITKVVIEEGITHIGDSAFENFFITEEFVIPGTVTTIGKRAFCNCKGVKSIYLPENLQIIDDNAFVNCSDLREINIPVNVNKIGDYAFLLCKRLHDVAVSDENLYFTLDEGTLYNKEKTEIIRYFGEDVDEYVVSEGVEKIGKAAFHAENFEKVVFPESLRIIDNRAFEYCESVEIIEGEENLKHIGENAFDSCLSLREFTIGENVETIGTEAFTITNLESVFIPKNVIYIGESPFCLCTDLKEIKVDEENPYYASLDGHLYTKDFSTLINCAVSNEKTRLVLPLGVEEIGKGCMHYYRSMEEIIIPHTLKKVDESSFHGCLNLKNIYYMGTKEMWNEIEHVDKNVSFSEKPTVNYQCGLDYIGDKTVSVKKGSRIEISVEVENDFENTKVQWDSDSKIIFEFLNKADKVAEIKGRIVGRAVLTVYLYLEDVPIDSVDIDVCVTGVVLSGSSNNLVTPDEILEGTITKTESEQGAFDTTVYYVTVIGENGEENTYPLADKVYFEKELYTLDDTLWILENSEAEITFVLRGGKIKHVNPYVPHGLFESAEITDCYMVGDKIYSSVYFNYLMGEFSVLVGVYTEDDMLYSAAVFQASYKDAYSYDVEISSSAGKYVKVFFVENIESLKPVANSLTCEIEK